jgi:hypothetical protein
MSSSKNNTAIKNANLNLTLKKKLGEKTPKQFILSLLPNFNAGIIVEKSIVMIIIGINKLPIKSIYEDTIINPSFYTNVKIPERIIDLLRDVRLAHISLDSSNTVINLGERPNEFINGIKIINNVGGPHQIDLNSVQSVYFPLETYRSNIPNVNFISFDSNSIPGDYILIIWYNAPLIKLSPGFRIITNNTNIEYNTV